MAVIGTCLLTGDHGPMIKAHILPGALTIPPPNEPFIQAGAEYRPRTRRSSWYDPAIVTRKGEDILTRYDDWAIKELRARKLVWSGWGDSQKLEASDYKEIPDADGNGFRHLKDLNGSMLRLFFLSLLWRAAVSRMEEFKDILLKSSDIRRIGKMLINRSPDPANLFPMSLIQLSTRFDVHNLTPLALDYPYPNGGTFPVFRFYMDGLIIIFRRSISAQRVQKIGIEMVGYDELVLGTVPFETSWQRHNMMEVMTAADRMWPDKARILKSW